MFITRECDYAVRIVRALGSGSRLAVKEICEAEYIPQPYAYKILKKLEKADIVQSYRGAYGGYELVSPLGNFSLYDIFMAVEEELYLNECLQGNAFSCPNNTGGCHCKVHDELFRLQSTVVKGLKRRSMAEILE